MHPLLIIFMIFGVFSGKLSMDLYMFSQAIASYNMASYLSGAEYFVQNVVLSDIHDASGYSFDYSIKKAGERGGIIKFSELLNRIKENYENNMEKTNIHTGNLSVSLDSKNLDVLLGMKNRLRDHGSITIEGSYGNLKVFEKTISYETEVNSTPRIQLLYDKARMFHYYAIEGKPVACLFWDGDNKITIKLKSFDGKGFKTYLYVEDKKYDIDLTKKQFYDIDLKLGKSNFTIRWKYCEDCDEEKIWILNGTKYSICINYNKNKPLEEYVYEKLENDKITFPRKVWGSESCTNIGYPSSGSEALAWKLCGRGSSSSCLSRKLDDLFENKIQGIMNSILREENGDGIVWSSDVDVDVSYKIEDSYTCSWGECCSKCRNCRDAVYRWECSPCQKESSLKNYYSYVEVYPSAKYSEDYVFWKFRENFDSKYLTPDSIDRYKSCPSSDNRDSCCTCNCDCSDSPGPNPCPCGGSPKLIREMIPCKKCDYKILHKWAYSYSYTYSFDISITIKDTKNKIIITV